LAFAVAFFGWLGGAVAFAILETGLLQLNTSCPAIRPMRPPW